MTRIVALSSYVAHGHVGLSAFVSVLSAQAHEVVALPTVILSNHAGLPHVGGFAVPVSDIDAMVDALEANGTLACAGTLLTGYLPSAGHVAAAVRLVARLRAANPNAYIVCDPVLGDWPKGLYIDAQAASALRDDLLPLANLATPNAFELEWLSGQPAGDAAQAIAAARALPCQRVLATSIPDGAAQVATVLVDEAAAAAISWPRFADVPHGPGDLLAGLVTSLLASGATLRVAVERACTALEIVLKRSRGRGELDLSPLIGRELPPAGLTLVPLASPVA